MKLAVITAHALADSLSEAVLSWGGDIPLFIENGKHGMLNAYQVGFAVAGLAEGYDLLAFIHDDVIIHDTERWFVKVRSEFEDPRVGLVGFGGALGHGSPELYKVPYDYHQLGRSQFLSNMDDAEVHGKRFTGSCDVAVLDGFSLIVRRQILETAGGWPVNNLGYVGYDYWLSCMTRRLGYRIRLVGVSCAHLGGRTFVKLGLGQGPEHWAQFLAAHEYIYNEFRDVLPVTFTIPL